MASDKLKKILDMSKNMDRIEKKTNNTPSKPMKTSLSLSEKINNASKAISNIDAMYNSPYIPTEEEKQTWNTERGRQELTQMANQSFFMEKLNKSHLPKAILESMKQNPCNYDPSMFNEIMGPENELFKKLNEAYAKDKEEPISGVKVALRINEQLENKNKEGIDESIQHSENITETNSFDIAALEQIIERVIDRKFNMINETIAKNGNGTMKSMSITENGAFRFLDSEDNVYECQMKYLGKRKRNKK